MCLVTPSVVRSSRYHHTVRWPLNHRASLQVACILCWVAVQCHISAIAAIEATGAITHTAAEASQRCIDRADKDDRQSRAIHTQV